MLGALRLAPARLFGPQAPHSVPCALDAHSRMAPRPPRRRRRRAPCALQHRRMAVDEPCPAGVCVFVGDRRQVREPLGHMCVCVREWLD
eukprot:2062679-Prymnesium_polylepis.1